MAPGTLCMRPAMFAQCSSVSVGMRSKMERMFCAGDSMLFSPAEVWLTSAITGRTFHAGRLNPDVLGASLYGN